jgi:OOP family OmpA-OmpF porin
VQGDLRADEVEDAANRTTTERQLRRGAADEEEEPAMRGAPLTVRRTQPRCNVAVHPSSSASIPRHRRHRRLRGAVVGVLASLWSLGACTDDDAASPASQPTSSIPEVGTTPRAAATSTTIADPRSVDDEQFERWLRDKLALPTLPSFAVPLDVFADAADVRLAEQLDIPPGLYEGIAVVDLRCREADASAADASGSYGADASGRYAHDGVEIVVQSDGSGRYVNGATTIVVQSDGSGSYQSDTVTLEIQGDGSGSYRSGATAIDVDSDRSGTFVDDEVRVEVTANGASTYETDDVRIEVSADGVVVAGASDPHADVVARVLADGLPLFPPVPNIGRLPEPVAGDSCGSVIRLDANVLFEFDADTVAPDAAALLDRVATLLTTLGSPSLDIVGHTDAIGGEQYNRDLSTRRAESVRRALVERGVAAESLQARGLGEVQPIAPNTTPEGADDPAGRRLNRRVELVLEDTG